MNGITPIAFSIWSVVVVFHHDRLLLLRRASWKRFAPGRWTGIGGRVEADELDALDRSAWREVQEETDLSADDVSPLTLRRVLTLCRPGEGLVCLVYFTTHATTDRVPLCNEGTLAWVDPGQLPALDILDNTALVLPLLIADVRDGRAGVLCGTGMYAAAGEISSLIWGHT